MDDVDLLRPGNRLPEAGAGAAARLNRTFNAMLARLEAERGASTRAALAAQEAERARIARELHDEIGQNLTAVLLGISRAATRAPDDLADELRALGETVRSGLDEVRRHRPPAAARRAGRPGPDQCPERAGHRRGRSHRPDDPSRCRPRAARAESRRPSW